MQRYKTTSKNWPNDPMGFDFIEYMTEVGNYFYSTTVNETKGTVYVSVVKSSEMLPF